MLSNKRIRTFNRKTIKRNESSKKRDSQYQWNNNKKLYYWIVEIKEIECQEIFEEEEWKD